LPGQPGTNKYLEKFGENLICVRYRYDSKGKRKVKTVELVIEDEPWQYTPKKTAQNKILNLHIDYDETYFRKLVKAAGGRWNPQKRSWQLAYKDIIELGLTDRIIDEGK